MKGFISLPLRDANRLIVVSVRYIVSFAPVEHGSEVFVEHIGWVITALSVEQVCEAITAAQA